MDRTVDQTVSQDESRTLHQRARRLLGRALRTIDAASLRVEDLILHDAQWRVRGIATDLPGTRPARVLPWESLDHLDTPDRDFFTRQTIGAIEGGPTLESLPPVRYEYDTRCERRFGLWYRIAGPALPAGVVERDLARALERSPEDGGNLRSLREILGYALETPSGECGRVEDLFLELPSGRVKGLVIDTRRFLPGGRTFLLEPSAVDRIEMVPGRVVTSLSSAALEELPEVDPLATELEAVAL